MRYKVSCRFLRRFSTHSFFCFVLEFVWKAFFSLPFRPRTHFLEGCRLVSETLDVLNLALFKFSNFKLRPTLLRELARRKRSYKRQLQASFKETSVSATQQGHLVFSCLHVIPGLLFTSLAPYRHLFTSLALDSRCAPSSQ